MLALLYILISVLIGREVTELFLLRRVRETTGNRFWLLFPMAFGSGTLIVTWLVYAAAYMVEKLTADRHPLFIANLVILLLSVLYLCIVYVWRKKTGRKLARKNWIQEERLFRKELIFFALLFLFILYMMFYVFRIKDGYVWAGFTVFSDYAPHTSMIRSFSFGNNFPTQYPHFGGMDVKYHFMFQFLTGNLEYLGLRMDIAYNLVSTLSLWSFLVMFYKLAGRLMGRYLTGAIAVILFFFRSGTAFYRFVMESYKEGELIGELIENTEFIGYTPNENWGLWCFNVYLNQRHLGFGLLIVTMALWIFMDWLEDGDAHTEKGAGWMADRLYAPESWKSKDLPAAAVVGILLGLTSFWNGAAVIGGLLILAGFALFSDGKVDYAVMAGITIILSVLQSRYFMTGSAVDFSLYWGFIAEDRSIMGILWFVIQLSGIYYFAMLVISVYLKRIQRSAMTAFFLPFVFAFTVSLTPDITVNHKYIMMSYAFLAMFWAFAFVEIWRLGKGMQIVSVLAAVALLATGIYDFVIIIRDNDVFHRVIFEEDNELTGWISENLSSQELVLTPEYSINEVTLSGVMMYCGWPYYAWSAGYDTDMRAKLAEEIYTSSDEARVSQLVEQEGITYILYETGMEYEGQICQEDTIRALYEPVFETSDQYYRIYKVD